MCFHQARARWTENPSGDPRMDSCPGEDVVGVGTLAVPGRVVRIEATSDSVSHPAHFNGYGWTVVCRERRGRFKSANVPLGYEYILLPQDTLLRPTAGTAGQVLESVVQQKPHPVVFRRHTVTNRPKQDATIGELRDASIIEHTHLCTHPEITVDHFVEVESRCRRAVPAGVHVGTYEVDAAVHRVVDVPR